MWLDWIYRASFLLYEISFLLFALGLGLYGEAQRRLTRALQLPSVWWLSSAAAVLMLACALLHFYVYHHLSPRYLTGGDHDLLLQMYLLKSLSMLSIFLAGAALTAGNLVHWLRIRR